MIESVAPEPISAREAETEIPDLEEFAGCEEILPHLELCLKQRPGTERNMLFEGKPGTGKTSLALAFLRKRFQNPLFYNGDIADYWENRGVKNANADEVRLFQRNVPGCPLAFMAIHGGTDSRASVNAKIVEIMYNVEGIDHFYVLLDEAGEACFKEIDEMLRPILTDPRITVLATAQNFHAKRRSDTSEESQDRLAAFLRRFGPTFRTSNPTPRELLNHLVRRMKRWQVKVDHPETLKLLAYKSKCVVGYALRGLAQGIDTPDRILTRAIVESYDVDPLTR